MEWYAEIYFKDKDWESLVMYCTVEDATSQEEAAKAALNAFLESKYEFVAIDGISVTPRAKEVYFNEHDIKNVLMPHRFEIGSVAQVFDIDVEAAY